MRAALRSCALLLAAAGAICAANPAQQLFDRVRGEVLDNTRRVPRYTCEQTIDRTESERPETKAPARCEAGQEYLVWRDRLRLDVAVVDGKETFSWAGARQFETSDIAKLISTGSAGSGDFAGFLSTVFSGHANISLLREVQSPTDLSATFGFTVPAAQSRYLVRARGGGPGTPVGFHGTFVVDEASAELRRLTIEADQLPPDEQACRLDDVMDYHSVKIGDGDFLLPETSTMTVLFNDGGESRNQTHYSNCREYAADSTISFAADDTSPRPAPAATPAAPGKLPPHLRLRIGLKSTIRSETAAAGDAIEGVLLRDVRDSDGHIVAHANDIVHGRIIVFEQHVIPARQWVVALQFRSIEHNGVETPLDLKPLYDLIGAMQASSVIDPPSPGAGVFVFPAAGNLVLDQSFHSEWETR